MDFDYPATERRPLSPEQLGQRQSPSECYPNERAGISHHPGLELGLTNSTMFSHTFSVAHYIVNHGSRYNRLADWQAEQDKPGGPGAEEIVSNGTPAARDDTA